MNMTGAALKNTFISVCKINAKKHKHLKRHKSEVNLCINEIKMI